ncbi:hypothetical protein SPLC1_S205460 [Arthrospira platensis C1]|nr:hypothetical protein SPLC1_S205460 [Arthrospira platensis C1]
MRSSVVYLKIPSGGFVYQPIGDRISFATDIRDN